MRQAYERIPIYTADVSGVCSALYELGGMTVIHDPSGCNSTYNTHDETRWYDRDSLIFISGLTERDAIMGNDKKFVEDVVSAAKQLKPKFIALVGSPIPFLNGTDFRGLAKLIEKSTGIPAFFVPTNGMHDYIQGAGNALAELAKRFVRESERTVPHGVNLLGMTPLDFTKDGSVEALRAKMEAEGFSVTSCWAMGDSLEQLAEAGEAEVNLVVSSVGLAAARVLKKRFGTPYVVGTPIDDFAGDLFEALKEAKRSERDLVPYLSRMEGKAKAAIIGEPVIMGSLAAAISEKYRIPVQVLCPLETREGLLAPGDLEFSGEEALIQALAETEIVIGDPLYQPLCGNRRFYQLPHQAFSGRCFRKEMVNLFDLKISTEEGDSYGNE